MFNLFVLGAGASVAAVGGNKRSALRQPWRLAPCRCYVRIPHSAATCGRAVSTDWADDVSVERSSSERCAMRCAYCALRATKISSRNRFVIG